MLDKVSWCYTRKDNNLLPAIDNLLCRMSTFLYFRPTCRNTYTHTLRTRNTSTKHGYKRIQRDARKRPNTQKSGGRHCALDYARGMRCLPPQQSVTHNLPIDAVLMHAKHVQHTLSRRYLHARYRDIIDFSTNMTKENMQQGYTYRADRGRKKCYFLYNSNEQGHRMKRHFRENLPRNAMGTSGYTYHTIFSLQTLPSRHLNMAAAKSYKNTQSPTKKHPTRTS